MSEASEFEGEWTLFWVPGLEESTIRIQVEGGCFFVGEDAYQVERDAEGISQSLLSKKMGWIARHVSADNFKPECTLFMLELKEENLGYTHLTWRTNHPQYQEIQWRRPIPDKDDRQKDGLSKEDSPLLAPGEEEWREEVGYEKEEYDRVFDTPGQRQCCDKQSADGVMALMVCLLGVSTLIASVSLPFSLGYYQLNDAYPHFGWILPFSIFGLPALLWVILTGFAIIGRAIGANSPMDIANAALPVLVGVGCSMAIANIAGLMLGVQAGKLIVESDRILTHGEDPYLCPSGNPLLEKSAAGVWVPGCSLPTTTVGGKAGRPAQGEASWYVSGEHHTSYYCLTIAPVLAPSKGEMNGGHRCIANTPGQPIKVSYWAFYSQKGYSSGDCSHSAVAQRWPKRGAIIKDAKHMTIVSSHGNWGDKSGSDLVEELVKAKKDFMSKFNKGGKAYTDHPDSKYVILSDHPMKAAKGVRNEPYYLYAGAFGIWVLAMCVCACGVLRGSS